MSDFQSIYIAVCVIFSFFISEWARKWNKSPAFFYAISCVFTPAAGAILLLIMGKENFKDDIVEGPDEVPPTDTSETIIGDGN